MSCLVALVSCASAAIAAAALVDYVDPLIGSGGGNGLGSFSCANVNPGAQAPFGLLRLGPDTTWAHQDGRVVWIGNDHIAGYNFNDTHVLAFSHTHVQGAGCGDGGSFGVALAASSDVVALVAGGPAPGDAPYKTALVHGPGEQAMPGFYSLALPGVAPGASASLAAAGTHSGMHVYECPAAACALLIDACHGTHSGGCPSANASIIAAAPAADGAAAAWSINASVLDNGYFAQQGGGVWVHGAAFLEVFTAAAADAASVAEGGVWSARVPLPPGTQATAANDTTGSVGAWVTVAGPARFELRVGLSLVSPAAAAANLALEQQQQGGGGGAGSGWLPFDALRTRASAAWEAELGRVALCAGADAGAEPPPPAPPGCPPAPPPFDPAYLADLHDYFADAGGALWLDRQGLPRNASGGEIAARVWAVSCFAPPPLGAAGWRRVLYTALYHALAAPTTVSDPAGGAYVGLDGHVRTAPAAGLGVAFSDLSLWDIHRSQAPLLALLHPAASASLAASLLAMADARGGVLPRWPFASVETRIMCADHGIAVLADAALKGVLGAPGSAEIAAAWAAANATLAVRGAASAYAALGWVPVEEDHGYCRGGSLTLEYAFDDAAAAVLAQAAGDAPAAAALAARARSYRNLWSPAAGALCPRHANGTLQCSADALLAPFPFNSFWTEADGAQMAWFAPGDPAGLASLYPTQAAYLGAWDALMAATPRWPFGSFLPNAALWWGNEPSLLVPWQAAFAPPAGAARVQAATRGLLRAYYTARFDGVPGNDDYGTMSAAALWSLLGLYPLAGSDAYVLGSPTFANVSVALGDGGVGGGGGQRRLTILARNASSANMYVAQASLNGVRLPAPFVRHADLVAPPALLEFVMTSEPTPWG